MDDFLYIIIGIAWVAYSLYSNKQKQDRKRAARETQGKPVSETPSPVRSILEEIFMGEASQVTKPAEAMVEEYQPEYLPTTEATSSEIIRAEAESLEEIVEEVPANYFEKEYTGRSEAERVVARFENEADIETEEPGFEIARDFDLKTAVIYAEILNPRHF
ncbi:MAG: hypothetical protein V1775_03285 [Bacteroidota bacterium]